MLLCAFGAHIFFFFLLLRRPPISTLFPYTTLFRSYNANQVLEVEVQAAGNNAKVTIDRNTGLGPEDIAQATSNLERSEEHTSELQSLRHLVCRLLLEKKKNNN